MKVKFSIVSVLTLFFLIEHRLFHSEICWKWKWRDIRPSMVTHTRNLCSAFIPSKVHTHSSEYTHTVNTHPEQWAAIYAAAPGEQLGVRCLAQGHLSRGVEGGHNSCRTWDSNPRPLGYESDSLSIRPRLPPMFDYVHYLSRFLNVLKEVLCSPTLIKNTEKK